MRQNVFDRKEDILVWIEQNQSKAFIARQLGCKPTSLQMWLPQMGITYIGNKPGKGIKASTRKKTALEYLNSTYIKSHLLRLKILEDGIKEHKCERCLCIKWLEKPIPLELHHKDGDHNNNNLDNLELLCPNCHAFTDTYRGKNKNRMAA